MGPGSLDQEWVDVPDVSGLPFAVAARLGDDAGLTVTGIGPDGRGVEADSEGIVLAQDPLAGASAEPGSRLVLHVGGSGDRAVLTPPPSEHGGDRDPSTDVGTDINPRINPVVDPDVDPDLQPA